MTHWPPGISLEAVDDAMLGYIRQRNVAGIHVLAAHQGQVILDRCYGVSRLGRKLPVTEDTIYRIFSMTKPITSLAVMMLWEEGRFDLFEPVDRFLPSFRRLRVYQDDGSRALLARPITFHDLLTHTSGLGYGLDRSSPVERMYARANILRTDEPLMHKMERIADLPLHHQPGERFTYSVGTDVLGTLVERISGQTLDRFFRERIFEPLDMPDTGFSVSWENRSHLAGLYTRVNKLPLMDVRWFPEFLRPTFLRGAWVRKTQVPAFLSGGGGLVSTMKDYFQFVGMLSQQGEWNGNRLISADTLNIMTSPQLREDQNPVRGLNVGYGFSVLTDPADANMPASAGSFGASGAAGTDFWVDPAREMMGILMIQYVSTQAVRAAADFARLALTEKERAMQDEST